MPSLKITLKNLQSKVKRSDAASAQSTKQPFVSRLLRKKASPAAAVSAAPVTRETSPFTVSPTSTACPSRIIPSTPTPTPPPRDPNAELRRRHTQEEAREIEFWLRSGPKIRMRPMKPAPSMWKSLGLSRPALSACPPKTPNKCTQQQRAHVEELLQEKGLKEERREREVPEWMEELMAGDARKVVIGWFKQAKKASREAQELRARMEEKDQQIEELKSWVQVLEANGAAKDERIAELKARTHELEASGAAKDEKLGDAENRVEELQVRVQELEAIRAEQEKEVGELGARVQELEKERAEPAQSAYLQGDVLGAVTKELSDFHAAMHAKYKF
ncbi:hypothetical protein OE88DRAFT_1810057 [Heliocybe sulcata]|uniref:Uncharacterized protein n=1 Tax=Heliocybe sulcata TaxID=5364 RepID=A0A5C3MWR8_9AGAM|nr:hypothetical protein OE88DRAFT_1810057 [Heliocybe sulcata]